jgi:hypothetical protein
MVVLPAASRPTIRIRISFFPHRPMIAVYGYEPVFLGIE